MFRTHAEARAQFLLDKPRFERAGVFMPGARAYVSEETTGDFRLALDAIAKEFPHIGADLALAMDAVVGDIPSIQTLPNSAVPMILTTLIDPVVYEILFALNKAAVILGEVRKGTWLDETAMFPTVEHSGEVSSYGDYSMNGVAGANTNWPQRQAYLFQAIKQYGERELERAGLGRVNWVSELDKAAATVMAKFLNLTYFFGVLGLQNYGLLNDPNLTAALTPAPKAAGGNAWISGGIIKATANEVYADVEALFYQLVQSSQGLVEKEDRMTLATSPTSAVAFTATNSFNVNVSDLLKKNFPNLKIETAVQYAAISGPNPQGNTAGSSAQLIAHEVEGQSIGYCAFNEKMRAHKIIQDLSAYRQKITGGTWGTILRQPWMIATMIGV